MASNFGMPGTNVPNQGTIPQMPPVAQPQNNSLYGVTQYFPQPQGNIYMLASSNETGNIPIGNGLSAGICLSEGTMYLKTFQNGAPMMLSYKLIPFEQTASTDNNETNKKIVEMLNNLNERLLKIEGADKKEGGKLDWAL